MVVTRERFAQGMTYDAFKAQMTRNRDRFEANERRLDLDPADLAAFHNLPRPLQVLVLAEDWCGDVIDNLPVLGRIAAESGKLDLRIFLRDQNLDLMDQYLNQGRFRSIPVFVFFDDHLDEIGRFVERPASVTERRARQRHEIFAQHPEFGSPDAPVDQLPEDARVTLTQALARMRDELKPRDNRDWSTRCAPSWRAAGQRARVGTPTCSQEKAMANRPVKVTIAYCAECGYEPQTLALAGALMTEFGHALSSIELIPWDDGTFEVSVAGQLVHSMVRDGGFPEHATIAQAVRMQLAADGKGDDSSFFSMK